MPASVLLGGGVSTTTNATNAVETFIYFAFAFGLPPGTHSASLSIDAITAGTVKIYMSNDTLADSGSTTLDENTATAAQFNALTWIDRTARFAPAGVSPISGIGVIDFDTNISYRFMRVGFTPSNATNSLVLRYHVA